MGLIWHEFHSKVAIEFAQSKHLSWLCCLTNSCFRAHWCFYIETLPYAHSDTGIIVFYFPLNERYCWESFGEVIAIVGSPLPLERMDRHWRFFIQFKCQHGFILDEVAGLLTLYPDTICSQFLTSITNRKKSRFVSRVERKNPGYELKMFTTPYYETPFPVYLSDVTEIKRGREQKWWKLIADYWKARMHNTFVFKLLNFDEYCSFDFTKRLVRTLIYYFNRALYCGCKAPNITTL